MRKSSWIVSRCTRCGIERKTQGGICYRCRKVIIALKPEKNQPVSFSSIKNKCGKHNADLRYHGNIQ